MSGFITGITRGGAEWTPEFVTGVDAHTCIGCGRCYKVCSRDVFNLVDKADLVDEDELDDDQDDVMMVMTVANADDCIGCGACSRVCPKNCHSHAAMSA
ncbi:MAG: ferredoxin III, nif-specific [Tolumonas sp.]